MTTRIKPHKLKGRQLEEVREKDLTAASLFITARSTAWARC
jgi:hypothetical protein